jgi:hypothetical protein
VVVLTFQMGLTSLTMERMLGTGTAMAAITLNPYNNDYCS